MAGLAGFRKHVRFHLKMNSKINPGYGVHMNGMLGLRPGIRVSSCPSNPNSRLMSLSWYFIILPKAQFVTSRSGVIPIDDDDARLERCYAYLGVYLGSGSQRNCGLMGKLLWTNGGHTSAFDT